LPAVYRDGLKTARDRLDSELARIDKREQPLTEEMRKKLPAAPLRQLDELRAQLVPREDTVDAVEEAERAVEVYERKLGDVLNLVAQLRGHQKRGERSERLRGSPIANVLDSTVAQGGFILLVGVLLVTAVPSCILGRAAAEGPKCLIAVETERAGDPDDCRAPSLEWPAVVPWFRRDAVLLQRELDQKAAHLRLRFATSLAPSADARTAAAKALLDSHPEHGEETHKQLADAGAFEALASTFGADRSILPLRAAIVVADVELMSHLAGMPDKRPEAAADNLVRGATLCLFGDKRFGLEMLELADRQHRAAEGTNAYGPARIAMVACGGEPVTWSVDPFAVAGADAAQLLILGLSDPNWMHGRRYAVAAQLAGYGSVHPGAHAVAGAVQMTLGSAATRPDHITFSFDASAAPWMLLEPGASAAPVLLFQQAAEAVAKNELGDTRVAIELLQLAAHEHARRGDIVATRETVRRAESLATDAVDGPQPWQSAGLLLTAGDAPGALEQIERMAADPNAQPLSVQRLRALALAGAGKLPKASQVADAIHDDLTASGIKQPESLAWAGWLRAALALAKGGATAESVPGLKPVPAEPQCDIYDEGLAPLRWWWHLATAPDDDRGEGRFTSWPLKMRWTSLLPAVLVVVGHAAGEGNDVEVWLDHMFGRAHLEDSRRMMFARAIAAQWRGDHDAVEVWRQRASRLLPYIKNYRAAVLATLAGW